MVSLAVAIVAYGLLLPWWLTRGSVIVYSALKVLSELLCGRMQLRRLLSVALAAKLGSFKLSQFLEEVPGDSALAEIPDSVLKTLSERLKLEMKLEQLATGK